MCGVVKFSAVSLVEALIDVLRLFHAKACGVRRG